MSNQPSLASASSPSQIKTYFRLLAYLKGLRWFFALSIAGFAVFAASQPMLAKVMELIINAIEHKDADARWFLPFLAVGVFFLRGVGSFLGVYYNEYVGASVVNTVKLEVFRHLTVLPAEFYNATSQGSILHNLNSGVGLIQAAVTNALKIVVREGLTIICLLGYVFYLNWQLSLVFLAISPALAFMVSSSTRRLRSIGRKNENVAGQLLQVSKEMISNYGVVRGFGAEEYEATRYQLALNRSFNIQMKVRRISAVFGPLSQLIVSVAVATIVFLLLNPFFLDNNSTGELVGYLTAVALIPKSLQQLSGVNLTIQQGLVGAEMVFGLLDLAPERDEGVYEAETVRGDIEVKNLSFRYPATESYVLKDISFSVRSGEMIALVGKSGSGKSTLAGLINRLYEVEDGKIFLDGTDVNHYKLVNLRKHISTVSQNIALFEDTVRNNVAYGDRSYSDSQIKHALDCAHAGEFINNLPHGIDTMIGENGLRLSGGQRQRLSLARAFLKDSPVLILDEATSALDNESESIVTRAIEELTQARTTIVIAHRLSTILKADRLLVMDDGQIIESGTHSELLQRKGYYAELYNADYQGRDQEVINL